MRVSCDEVETAKVLALGNGYERLVQASISIESGRQELYLSKFRPIATYSSHLVGFGAREPARMFVWLGGVVKSCERPPVLALPVEKGSGLPRSFIVAGVWLVVDVAVLVSS